jgi:transcriptional regulator of arginine metabolism
MKNRRQMMILDIIEQLPIETQEELADELRKRGLQVTQATISRDIKELRLVKLSNGEGKHCYTVSHNAEQEITDRQIRIFVDSVVSVKKSQNLVVLKTISGSANAAAETLDAFKWPEIVGSIAGDNTILIVTDGDEASTVVLEKLRNYLR